MLNYKAPRELTLPRDLKTGVPAFKSNIFLEYTLGLHVRIAQLLKT